MMISTLVVEMGMGPYSFDQVVTAAEDALSRSLAEEEKTVLKSHAFLRTDGAGNFLFRFDYLVQFAPAVWLCEYLLSDSADPLIERYLGSIVGRSLPILGYVVDLLRDVDYKPHLVAHAQRLRRAGIGRQPVAPFLWEVAQSLFRAP